MRARILISLWALSLCALALANNDQQDDDTSVIELPLRQRLVTKEALRTRQANKLAKLGRTARQLPKYDPRLLEGPFKYDYLEAKIQFGTPAQDLTVAVSSGAARAYVIGPDFKLTNRSQTPYRPRDSSTATDLGYWNKFPDGAYMLWGEWYTDNMRYGKAKIPNQGLVVLSKITGSDDFDFPVDGILGLNHPTPAYYESHDSDPASPIDNLLKPLAQKMFTVWLDRANNGLGQGQITIGGYDKSHCDSKNSYQLAMLTESKGSDYRYVVYSLKLTFGDYTTLAYGSAYFDTSLSTIQLSYTDVQEIYNRVGADYDWDTGLYTVGCRSVSDLDTLSIQFDINGLDIGPDAYAVDVGLDENRCALAISTIGDNYSDEKRALGTPAFRNRCLTYDFDFPQILVSEAA